MKFRYLLILTLSISIISCEQGTIQLSKNLNSKSDSISYSLGINIATNLKKQGIENINTDAFTMAIEDIFNNDSTLLINQDEATEIIKNYFIEANKNKISKNLSEAQAFLAKNKSEKNVISTQSGLQYIIQNQGKGTHPNTDDIVSVHYIGYYISGEEFYNTYSGNPVTFPVKNSTKAWQEILQLMSPGSKIKMFVHPDLAYGSEGAGNIEPNSLLIYDLELISIDTPTK